MYLSKLKKYTNNEIKNNLFIAIDQLFKKDNFLLENEAHERSLAHKLAEYLQELFQDWNVDCEYNKKGLDIKRMSEIIGCQNLHETDRILPDIIIHHRGYENNLLVIEMKTKKSSTVNECDDIKLKEFTKPDGKYKYQLGLFIGFEKLKKPQLVWYKNGEEKT